MQPGITRFIKQAVIEDWFLGLRRDDIAEKHGIGTGTVSGIIRDWVADFVDGDTADAMRYLAVAFRKRKLTIPQCVLGARTGIMMNNLGIQENDFDAFISGTYKFLKELAVDPKKLAHYIKQIEELAPTMPIAQIPQYISELADKKKQMSEEMQKLQSVELDMKVKVDNLKKEAHDLDDEIQRFAGIKFVLKKYGVEINNVELFAKAVKEAHELGYEARLIGSKLAYWDALEMKEMDLSESVHNLEAKKEALETQIREAKRNYYSIRGY